MFISGIDALIKDSNEKDKPVWQLMMEYESDSTGATIEEIYNRVAEIYSVMKAAIKNGIDTDIKSVSGLSGGDAKRYNNQIETQASLLSHFQSKAIAYSLATSEHNASMGVIAAAPTGKIKTITQMIAIPLLLLDNWPFAYIGIPMDTIFLWIAVIMTVVSGTEYFWKNRQLLSME